MAGVPNIPHESVPVGRSAEDNLVVRTFGDPRVFDFEPKAHWDISPDLVNSRFRASHQNHRRPVRRLFRAGREAGARANQLHARYTYARARIYGGASALRCQLGEPVRNGPVAEVRGGPFQAGKTDYWLIPTAEVPVTGLFRDETRWKRRSFRSTSALIRRGFRSEAGSYGRDVRGIIRQHQFQKVELVKFARPDESYDQLDRLDRRCGGYSCAGLNCRSAQSRCVRVRHGLRIGQDYGIEVWLPGQNGYKEISSCSNYEAFQARRANIRMQGQARNPNSRTR